LAEPLPQPSVETFTASDGYRWYFRRYLPSGPPRAQVVFLHGIQSHGGWYTYSCGRLCQDGYAVSFLDRRGSGLNQEGRGDASSYRRLVDDVAEFIKSQGATVPVFLAAISWGGKVAVAALRQRPDLVNGLILLCPGFFPQVRPPFKERLTIAWSRLAAPQRLFDIPLNNVELFTATPHWQAFLRGDPLSLQRATARLLVESVRLDRTIRSAAPRITVPVLLLLAERDRIILNKLTRDYVQHFAAQDKEVIEYPNAHHTLEFEPDPERFLADIKSWLARHPRA
jgi:alpha-beta hydrolase superfamily lysophospholipase